MPASPSPLCTWPLHGPVFSVSLPPAFDVMLAAACVGALVTTHFLLGSWYPLRALTQSQPPSVLTTQQSCHLQWSAQEALGTLDPHPFSKCDFKEGMTQGEGAPQLNPGLGKGAPSLFSSPTSPPSPLALMPVEAARRTWTMTRRPTPWYLPNGSGPDGGMAQNTVCIPHFQLFPADSS